MAGFTDLMRGGGASPVDRYVQGMKLGIELEQDEEQDTLRKFQAQKIVDELKRKRRTASPDFGRHVLTIQDPSIAPDSDSFKEAAAVIQGAGLDVWSDVIAGRNTNALIADRMRTEKDDELLTAEMAQAIGGVTGQDLSGAVGKVTRGEAMSLGKEAGVSERAERTAGLGQQRVDIAAQNASTARLRAETAQDLAAPTIKLRDAQLRELDRVNAHGGFKTADSFSDWAVPWFLTILTNGRVARRGVEVPEAAIAEMAATAAWRRVTDQGMTVGDALADVSRQFDIKPTNRRPFGPDVQTEPDSLLEESKTKAKKPAPSDEALLEAIKEALKEE